MSELNGADIPLPAAIRRRIAKRNASDKPQPGPKPQIPRSKDEKSDDIVIKSRPSPIKSKAQPIRTMRELSDEPKPKPKPEPIPLQPERTHRRGLCPEPQMGRVSFKADPELLSVEELPPIPMMPMKPIMPPVRDRKRDKHEYELLRSDTDIAQSRLHYGTLERVHKTKSDMQRQALNKYVEDRRDERRHREALEREASTKYTNDRIDKRRHREELERQMYRDRNDERVHRERLEHDMMDHFASDRNDERQFQLAKMRIEHVEPLTRANIESRQQSLLEQDAALDRYIKRREHNNQLLELHKAYMNISRVERLEHVLHEFGVETRNYDDVYISPPVEETYMLGEKHYTYSHLCLGVKDFMWNEAADTIIINFMNGTQRVIPVNKQYFRTERFGNGILVIRFQRYINMRETKRKPDRSCPLCPNCDIA